MDSTERITFYLIMCFFNWSKSFKCLEQTRKHRVTLNLIWCFCLCDESAAACVRHISPQETFMLIKYDMIFTYISCIAYYGWIFICCINCNSRFCWRELNSASLYRHKLLSFYETRQRRCWGMLLMWCYDDYELVSVKLLPSSSPLVQLQGNVVEY